MLSCNISVIFFSHSILQGEDAAITVSSIYRSLLRIISVFMDYKVLMLPAFLLAQNASCKNSSADKLVRFRKFSSATRTLSCSTFSMILLILSISKVLCWITIKYVVYCQQMVWPLYRFFCERGDFFEIFKTTNDYFDSVFRRNNNSIGF